MAFILCIISIFYLITGIIYFGIKKTGYSHIKHTISELGESGSLYEKQVGYGLFLITGILLLAVALIEKNNTTTMGIAASLSAGYIIGAVFPCDPGSPSSGSWKQQLHNAGGFIEYAGSFYFIMKASPGMLWLLPYKTIGFALIICTLIISVPANPVRGLIQRLMEFIIFSCLLQQLI